MAEIKPNKIEATVHMIMELWPLWIVLAGLLLNYINQQNDVASIKTAMAEAKLEKDKQIAERDVRLSERQKKEDADHDKLITYIAIVDCMRHHNCQ